MIYLDYAATTPLSLEALDAYQKTAKRFFANSMSLHDAGCAAKETLEDARNTLSRLISAPKSGLYFTSGGTESNDLAIRSLVYAHRQKGKHLITTKAEHSSVLDTFSRLENEGFDVDYVPLKKNGQIKLEKLEKLLTNETILVSIAHVTSDLGTIQPIDQIGRMLKEKNILFHSDCVQSFGKIRVNVQKANLSAASFSAHKLYGPKSVGACYINPREHWQPLYSKAKHENGFRPGTVDVPGIAAFARAAQEAVASLETETKRMQSLRKRFISGIMETGYFVEGESSTTLPHHLPLRLPGVEGQLVMLELNQKEIFVSTGSACSANESHNETLLAMGKSREEARELIRITMGKQTTEEEMNETAEALVEISRRLKANNDCF